MNTEKITICFFSDANFLAVNLLENLLANNCIVNIYTDDVSNWKKRISHIASNNKFSINPSNSYEPHVEHTYTLSCAGFVNSRSVSKETERLIELLSHSTGKAILIFPGEVYDKFLQLHFQVPDNVGIVYVGDLLGPRIDLESDLRMPRLISHMIFDKKLDMEVGVVLCPLFVGDVSRQIVKWLFAFGPYGKETLLLGSEVSSRVFWNINTKLLGLIKYSTTPPINITKKPKIETHYLLRNPEFCLKETYNWLSNHPEDIHIKRVPGINKSRTKDKGNGQNKKAKTIAILISSLLVYPLIGVFLSAASLFISTKLFQGGSFGLANVGLRASSILAWTSWSESYLAKHIPFLGRVYRETEYASSATISLSGIGIEAIPTVQSLSQLANLILGKGEYSVAQVSSSLNDNLNKLYAKASTFKQLSTKASNEGSVLAAGLLNRFDVDRYINLLSQTAILSNELPEILGDGQSKTYLILFQNNMELRPTGGFIGSYGLLTLDKGRLTDFAISDIYTADGQLNGHVEPPLPIKNYLGEANWWFRDSNWDPDFPTSAKRAEWFLEKETDKVVDGVVAIDLKPIKDFLVISGPIYLQDYGMEISHLNLYEKVQAEVQDDFFPGTYKKTSFLTALSKSILSKLGTLSTSKEANLLKLIYQDLNERRIQVYIHSTLSQKALSSLDWDGAVKTPLCGSTCLQDMVGIVEANLGVNKSNYFIKRGAKLNVEYLGDVIKHTLILDIKNSANQSLGPSGDYKSYLRLLIPEQSVDILVEKIQGQGIENLATDVSYSKGHAEVGAFVDVLAGESKTIRFSWSNNNYQNFSEHNLLIRKQGGVDEYPFNINITSKLPLEAISPLFTLTTSGNYLYNTSLVSDLLIKLSY